MILIQIFTAIGIINLKHMCENLRQFLKPNELCALLWAFTAYISTKKPHNMFFIFETSAHNN